MKQEKCLQTMSLIAQGNECPVGCVNVQKALQVVFEEGDGSKQRSQELAGQICAVFCPNGTQMVLPRGSRRFN